MSVQAADPQDGHPPRPRAFRRHGLRAQVIGRAERLILGALMSLAAAIVDRQLRRTFSRRQ
ncbi:MAG: hypothetical protein M3075_18630 [Candidatus Dormibacteraeota bacterium]|nr:hypothetical protein [Candidatus Dormibacteraeota bacterium]